MFARMCFSCGTCVFVTCGALLLPCGGREAVRSGCLFVSNVECCVCFCGCRAVQGPEDRAGWGACSCVATSLHIRAVNSVLSPPGLLRRFEAQSLRGCRGRLSTRRRVAGESPHAASTPPGCVCITPCDQHLSSSSSCSSRLSVPRVETRRRRWLRWPLASGSSFCVCRESHCLREPLRNLWGSLECVRPVEATLRRC